MARTGVVALVIAIAAALGLFVGDAIRDDGALGAAAPASRTADTSFSLEAIAALAAIRDTSAAAVIADDYPDYGLRHAPAAQPAPRTSPSGATLE